MDDALDRFRAEDGGFYDTGADAEALVARPRDPSDNASPSGLSATVHALVGLAALTGEQAYREAAEEALATVATLAEKAPRFAGWSLAAAEAMVDGPREVAVVGRPGAERDALARAAHALPGALVVVAAPGESAIPLLEGRGEVDGRPAAYVCRHHVCAAPTTDPAALCVVGGRCHSGRHVSEPARQHRGPGAPQPRRFYDGGVLPVGDRIGLPPDPAHDPADRARAAPRGRPRGLQPRAAHRLRRPAPRRDPRARDHRTSAPT